MLVKLENGTNVGKTVRITESISDIQENILIDKHQKENELSQEHTHTKKYFTCEVQI